MAWSPYAVVSMWSAWGFHVPSTTGIVTRLFAKSASFYNPLIYFGMSSKFRKDVSVLLPCTRERREVVRLQHFKNIKPKAEAPPPPASLPVQKLEAKYATGELNQSNHDSDSGVNSPPETPPSDTQEVFHINLPSHIETSEYWCDRLWGTHLNSWNTRGDWEYFCIFWSYPSKWTVCVTKINKLFSESQVGFRTCSFPALLQGLFKKNNHSIGNVQYGATHNRVLSEYISSRLKVQRGKRCTRTSELSSTQRKHEMAQNSAISPPLPLRALMPSDLPYMPHSLRDHTLSSTIYL